MDNTPLSQYLSATSGTHKKVTEGQYKTACMALNLRIDRLETTLREIRDIERHSTNRKVIALIDNALASDKP